MKKILNINEEERSRILNMHENATKKHYINEVAAFGAKFPQIDKVILYTKKAGGEVVGAVLPEGTVWTFDGAKATTKTADGLTITYRCDRPAGGVTKGVSFNFTNGSVGLYTQTGDLDARLKKTFCETSSVPAPKPAPAPIDTKKPNDKVKELQIKLNSLPNVVSVTGSKLTEDGVFGAKTLEAALVALRGSSPEGVKSKEITNVPTGQTTPETLSTRPESSFKLD